MVQTCTVKEKKKSGRHYRHLRNVLHAVTGYLSILILTKCPIKSLLCWICYWSF